MGPPISLLLPPTLREDLWLDGYLEYPPAAKALYIYRTCMRFPGFKPRPCGTGISVTNHYTGSARELLESSVRLAVSIYIPRNCWEQWTREGTHARKTGSAVTSKTTRREDRRIVRQALVDTTVTPSTIRADVSVAIVPQTIYRHLAEANLKSKLTFRALPLTPEHTSATASTVVPMWNVADWQEVVFSDESRFVLGTDDNRVRVWWRHGERYNSHHTVLRHTARTAGVMVWGSHSL
ncbi:HTH_Tnp_Tc3_2 domain-containing protein [Trichonephila clavipes]|nr:HTH_Tnp_Tc3_2 domain-containing protein [Trichonephila clavipes]